ncbi:ATP-dependent DNA helicase RecG [Rhodococcus sp. BP-252]|uniref:ATP-dependent DNA helicase RecG n=1 Tax=unclassified Rhodococcus (in: high G+C Gram-positive bacteria) TaxID=192944 RepID=UPI001C9B147B|nr:MULTISPECIES: ATP-dependent DNA helicase RecG [unclassified Rhodococcus (in: high G+C Gram-positive bacteria)]MBY6411159.1 ATP-dependent DNA helicase RecG [Rhodococcus sp. BP-320]MBY6415818.1 ATP-dependent DNA helicase RecG [Rhodococcus sp. BP-321]MBY6424361.1 ATP-dependent DNA helicase RecG [Rhodococcus sp. BP-324]MBY6425855.1 ATP-dependent DNA helicase RecG [Rhodococcus sp. BP-323]MBY6431024.1 ATP-dependent DNA helicase RecG [Rhodococcus sp. BP-322]
MAVLSDRLDSVLGATVSTPLHEFFDISTVEDLLRHYPHRYMTHGGELSEKEPPEGEHITIVATISSATLRQMKVRKGQFLAVSLAADGQQIDASFFNPHKLKHVLVPGRRGMFSGKVKYFGRRWNLAHPSYVLLGGDDEDGAIVPAGRIVGGGALAGLARGSVDSSGSVDMAMFERRYVPIYPATKDVESWTFMRCVRQVLDRLDPTPDPVPADILADRDLVDLDTALRWIHFPDSSEQKEQARERLKFDEALAVQLVLASRRRDVQARSAPPCPPRTDGIAAEFERRLPFSLTEGQLTVAGEISDDLSQGHPMSRLLQGEVGSGKTVVALRAMLQVVDAGHQCALLAPTEVLAAQHARSITSMLGSLATAGELGSHDLATKVALLTGSMSTAAKRSALLDVVTGDAGIVIGTHALIQDRVEFMDLGMVVVDEQHRFGVEQRDALRGKAREGTSPHLLVMTATPIPRTIAMSSLGDLETSTLTQLPRGRSPIVSNVVSSKDKPAWVGRAWERIVEEVEQGRQAYVVCSRIGGDEDEKPAKKASDEGTNLPKPKAALDMFDMLRDGPLAQLRVGLLHGRMPSDEKDVAMSEFNAGEIDVLVCTTVVEVGVDVPNATVMVIVDADRFGISQLHQLRGRIGRGGHQGLCIMITQLGGGGPTAERLKSVAATNDGFELAKLDLAMRREGDVLGAAQSGTVSSLRLLSLFDDEDVIADAHDCARALFDADPQLENSPGIATMMKSAWRSDRIDFLDKS